MNVIFLSSFAVNLRADKSKKYVPALISRSAHSSNQYESQIFATIFFVYLLFEYFYKVKVLN
jgi:hypothetical protein